MTLGAAPLDRNEPLLGLWDHEQGQDQSAHSNIADSYHNNNSPRDTQWAAVRLWGQQELTPWTTKDNPR